MKQISIFFCCIIFSLTNLIAQEMKTNDLPYAQIPEYPDSYTAGSVAARMIDGLGFRYYWATEGLRTEDLAYKPSEKGRTCSETIDHLFSLSNVIVNATTKTANNRTVTHLELNYEEKRKRTLQNFKEASDILRESKDLSEYKLVFISVSGSNEYPFWNNINGPIADAIWHTGQIVVLRRASGNPFNSKVSVFTGKVRE